MVSFYSGNDVVSTDAHRYTQMTTAQGYGNVRNGLPGFQASAIRKSVSISVHLWKGRRGFAGVALPLEHFNIS